MKHSAASQPSLLDLVFAALSDPSRRSIVERLRGGEATVSDLAAPLHMSLPAVSKHLRVLERAGLLKRRVSGRTHYLKVNPKALQPASRWIERHRLWWESSLDRLEKYLAKPETSSQSPPPTKN
jgi:DNA-binding transcriptional ArsR family regulator